MTSKQQMPPKEALDVFAAEADKRGFIQQAINIRAGNISYEDGGLVCVDAMIAYAALSPTRAANAEAGWRLVPVEPVREMWAAGGDAVVGYKQRHHDKVVAEIWSAMLASSPTPPAPVTSANEVEREDAQIAMGMIADAETLGEAQAIAAAFLGGAA